MSWFETWRVIGERPDTDAPVDFADWTIIDTVRDDDDGEDQAGAPPR